MSPQHHALGKKQTNNTYTKPQTETLNTLAKITHGFPHNAPEGGGGRGDAAGRAKPWTLKTPKTRHVNKQNLQK